MENTTSAIRYNAGSEPRVSGRTAFLVFTGAAALVAVMIALVR